MFMFTASDTLARALLHIVVTRAGYVHTVMSACGMMTAQAACGAAAPAPGGARGERMGAARRVGPGNCGGPERGAAAGAGVAAGARRPSRRRAAAAVAAAAVEVSSVEDKWIAGSVERCATGENHNHNPPQRIAQFSTDTCHSHRRRPNAADADGVTRSLYEHRAVSVQRRAGHT